MKVLKVIHNQGVMQLKRNEPSQHQGRVRYERSAGMQCTKIAYLAIIFYIIRNINIWKQFDLDYILELEDRVFEDSHVNQALVVDELPLNFSTEGVYLSTKMLVRERNLFAEKNDLFANYKKYTESEITNMASFTCAVFSIGII